METLIILGGNPAYDAPADLNFGTALKNLVGDSSKLVMQLAIYKNDTTDFAHWHVPETHYLETWSDGRSFDGSATIMQPMISPLYSGRSAHEILAIFTDAPGASAYDMVQVYWRSQHAGDDFEGWWRRSVHDGYITNSAFPVRQVTARLGALPPLPAAPDPKAIEITSVPIQPSTTEDQQRLASGDAEAAFTQHVGQRGAHQSRHGVTHGLLCD